MHSLLPLLSGRGRKTEYILEGIRRKYFQFLKHARAFLRKGRHAPVQCCTFLEIFL